LTKGRIAAAHGRWGRPSKLPLPKGRSVPSSNTWFLRPTQVHNQRESRSLQPFFRAHKRNRQTDRQTTLLRL